MFDFDVGKLMIFGIVALAVIPPKDLPRVMRTVGQYVGKMRRMASEFQGQFMDAMKEADLDSVKKELTSLSDAAKIDTSFDPANLMRGEITNAIEPPKEVGTSTIALGAADPVAATREPYSSEVVVKPPETPDALAAPQAAAVAEPAAPSHAR
jgi:sec-independent protein translocase protein TatB